MMRGMKNIRLVVDTLASSHTTDRYHILQLMNGAAPNMLRLTAEVARMKQSMAGSLSKS